MIDIPITITTPTLDIPITITTPTPATPPRTTTAINSLLHFKENIYKKGNLNQVLIF